MRINIAVSIDKCPQHCYNNDRKGEKYGKSI